MMMKNMRNKQGQSSIEFIIVFSFALGFFVIFLGLGISMTLGYLVHYATFDASRVYLVQDGTSQNILQSEQYAMNQVGKLRAIKDYSWNQIFSSSKFRMEEASGFKFNQPGSGKPAEFTGIYFHYKKRLSEYAMLTGTQRVEYVSESFLGKEPLRAECLARICTMMGGCSGRGEVTAFDNGC